ncbi:MAG: glycosyltransferase family 4 protein [bacterium]|nr:glycosyltransferase family 4 protein [bacterium]
MHIVMIVQLLDYEDDICGFIHEWVIMLARCVAFLDVLTLRQGKVTLPDNVRVSVLKPGGHEGKLTATFHLYQALSQIIRQSPVDVIFTHMTPIYSVLAAPIAKLWQIPLVTWYTHRSVTPALRLAEKFSDKILTASQESFQLPSPKVIVTNHGINTRVFRPGGKKETNCLTICSMGRISPIKNYETLIKAAHILVYSKNITNFRLLIIGKEGTAGQRSYAQKLVSLVKKLQLEQYIEFVGSVPHRDILTYYQQSDVFVNMSPTGGMDKAVLEAMACEVPVVVCNTTFVLFLGKWREQLFFEERDAEGLAARLAELLNLSGNTRKDMGKDLRNIVKQEHDLERLVNRLISIFQSIQREEGKDG